MPVDTRGLWKKARPGAIWLWRVFAAAALAYLFILVLITASLQTSVSERLANLELPDGATLDYSAGYALWDAAERNRKALNDARKQERELIDSIDKANDEMTRALNVWSSSMESHDLLLQRLAGVPGCEFISRRAPGTLTTESVLSDLDTCLDLGTSVRAALREDGNALLQQAAQFRKADLDYRTKENEAAALKRRLDRVRLTITARSRADPVQATASKAFAELAAFSDDRLIGGRVFGSFPPAVIQILLAFVSGMFGALLVTLVLVVYPKHKLKLSTGGSSLEARIFLGGLISVCVFVVIGGGTAVLGTSEGFGDGEANFLAFCAIAILAGMFSDRVAQWLSGRADAFFSRDAAEEPEQEPEEEPDEEPEPEPDPADPQPPAG